MWKSGREEGLQEAAIDPLTGLMTFREFKKQVGPLINGIVRRELERLGYIRTNKGDTGEFLTGLLVKDYQRLDQLILDSIYLDVNHLNMINDHTEGKHLTGDKFLTGFGQILDRIFSRANDKKCHKSGDEFVFLSENFVRPENREHYYRGLAESLFTERRKYYEEGIEVNI